ncbi:nitrate reductase molybdenum cofactor assembly chaperone [Streptomyces sp. NPDC047841]|uniref:nitrate reductase molybdenum cofactor assembly chaperone n=1 Tax=Streptomyces sp. NPDC047841 TaxID=3154708 RepID=UPI003454B9C7
MNTSATAPATLPLIHQAASLLLHHPADDWPAVAALVSEELKDLPGRPAELLRTFCGSVSTAGVLELSARYISTFDRSRRRTLHLTYYTDGDTRRRGASLLRWRELYTTHGWEPPADELPDFLPLALEFAARCPEPGRQALQDHRAALELLRLALREHRSPYADVLEAVCGTLPGASPADRAAALRLARTGPPAEPVGLLPFPAVPPAPRRAPSAPHPQEPPR